MSTFASSLLLSASLLERRGRLGSSRATLLRAPLKAEPSEAQIIEAFGKQGIRINAAEAQGIRPNVLIALREARTHGIGNSKVDFAAVEIAQDLGLDTARVQHREERRRGHRLPEKAHGGSSPSRAPMPPPAAWSGTATSRRPPTSGTGRTS